MDFSLILFIAVVGTGAISLGYRLLFERRALVQPAKTVNVDAATQSVKETPTYATLPIIVEYARALFPIVLLVFALRSFVVEPFRIPSGSMLPSLFIGDFILVNKYTYGIRLPIINYKLVLVGSPARGDVMVFRYPRDPSLNFIKRVVGLPGDSVRYHNKKLFINNKAVPRSEDGTFFFNQQSQRGESADRYVETIDDAAYTILLDQRVRGGRNMEVRVPVGHYFVMGDNRDHSNDSRYWRFVPESHVVGKAFFIWFSWKGLSEGGVRWQRVGETIR